MHSGHSLVCTFITGFCSFIIRPVHRDNDTNLVERHLLFTAAVHHQLIALRGAVSFNEHREMEYKPARTRSTRTAILPLNLL